MVGSRLPLPILKYINVNSHELEKLINEYPFYQLPLIAKILEQSEAEQKSIHEFNFFGFNNKKLTQYAQLYATLSDPTSDAMSTIDEIESSSSFHDVHIDMHEIEVPLTDTDSTKIEEINSVDETSEIDFSFPFESLAVNPLTENELVEKNEAELNGSGETDVHDLVDQNALADHQNNWDQEQTVDQSERTEIVEINDITLPIESTEDDINIEFTSIEDLADEELAVRLRANNEQVENLDVLDLSLTDSYSEMLPESAIHLEFGLDNIISDEELSEKLALEDSFELNPEENENEKVHTIEKPESLDSLDKENLSHSQPELELDRMADVNLESENEGIIEFESLEETNYILPAAYEIAKTEEDSKAEIVSEETTNTLNQKSALQVNTSDSIVSQIEPEFKDFSSWLTEFAKEGENSVDFSKKLKDDEEELEDESLSKSIQANAINLKFQDVLLGENKDDRINKDDELEGVLKDSFFKTQVEMKKVSRKTPSDMRIQDEAQLSLQPLDIASETLAILYRQQGNIAKAIEIYKKLIALFPEKSSFFALQIENLRK